MATEEESIEPLREALAASPENVPLRRHLAQVLLSCGRAAAAEKEFREALARRPADADLKLGLAEAFQRQGKTGAALVLLEELVRAGAVSARVHLLHSRVLVQAGEVQAAVRVYRSALDLDPAATDTELAQRLGVGATPRSSDVVEGRVLARPEPGAGDDPTLEKPSVSFGDVGGMEELKAEIRMKIIHPLEHPEMFKAYGKSAGGGILMFGPPGCGKTHLARATAGEIRSGFISVGIHDVLDMWLGQSERNLHELFQLARRSRPCVLFFDEVDALAGSRTNMSQHAGRTAVNQFLAELDGIGGTNSGVLVLAATNAPWQIDSAFRRPGRFDRVLFVPPPDAPARAAILRIVCQGKPLADIDFDLLARKSEGFSGADLRSLVDVAVEGKLARALQSGRPEPLTTQDLSAAAAVVKPTTREWFATARNYALYSNQAGVYDGILEHLKRWKL